MVLRYVAAVSTTARESGQCGFTPLAPVCRRVAQSLLTAKFCSYFSSSGSRVGCTQPISSCPCCSCRMRALLGTFAATRRLCFAVFGDYSLANSLSCTPGCEQVLCSKMRFHFRLLLTDVISKIIETFTLDDFSRPGLIRICSYEA